MRRDLGREKDEVEAANVAELVAELEGRYGDVFARYLSSCHIFVNGSSTENLEGNETALSDGDEVIFMIQVVGG